MTKHRLLIVLICGFAFAIRLYGLGHQSLWYDETVSAYLAQQSPLELIAHTARDIHPPGYYLLLHFWTRLLGRTEFALAYFSLCCGLLLLAQSYRLARLFTDRPTATLTLFIMAWSPFGVWYAQEVRMYTLGAWLGVTAAYCLTQRLRLGRSRDLWGYMVAATLGLYTLYYFAFLLIALNFWAWLRFKSQRAFILFSLGLVGLAYAPWLPIVWRQVTLPPVPPWRNLEQWGSLPLEITTVFALGQAVDPAQTWPLIGLMWGLALVGAWRMRHNLTALSFMVIYLGLPTALILGFSLVTPLYHARYLFIYSPPFSLILAKAVKGRLATGLLLSGVVLSSVYALQQFHTHPRYQADDYRQAVKFIETQWQPHDVIMVNAGYVYTAFDYYQHFDTLQRVRLTPYTLTPTAPPVLIQTGSVNGSPQLGWGLPEADFYAMSEADTLAALQKLSQDFPRLWLLRAYDTVTDPQGVIRQWLTDQAILIEDQPFSGESNIRVQGYLFPHKPPHAHNPITFTDGITLLDWELPQQNWAAGQTIHLQLWWQADQRPTVDYKISLKLWRPNGELAAQGHDKWPIGTLYRATQWNLGQPVYLPDSLTLPPDLPPGQYWLNVELYHPDTAAPLPRIDGADPVVTLGAVQVF